MLMPGEHDTERPSILLSAHFHLNLQTGLVEKMAICAEIQTQYIKTKVRPDGKGVES